MRFRRISFVAGWAAVALLAFAGFATFGESGPSSDEIRTEAAAASIGHTAGAYAGIAFALLSDDPIEARAEEPEPAAPVASGTDGATESEQRSSSGTIAGPDTGWLSEVEVRALVSLYFQPEDVNRAVRVAWCESRFDPDSVDIRTGGVGLFHHLPQYWDDRARSAGFPGADPTDPAASTAAAAWEVYHGGGWDVFTCRG